MIRKNKKYSRPRKPYDLIRFEEEKKLIKAYGLKNKREIWKADAAVSKIRRRAKELITADEEKRMLLVKKLHKQGFKVESIADILALNKEDYMKRRLQSILIAKEIVKSPKQARQLITHKHITIHGKVVDSPSYIVSLEEESKIDFRAKQKKKKEKEEKTKNAEEIKTEKKEKSENE